MLKDMLVTWLKSEIIFTYNYQVFRNLTVKKLKDMLDEMFKVGKSERRFGA